ncbi:MAG: hypothetical protein IT264_05675 [Saprospiraceae bacterium]|nr:hypothetical protein [Saprospiraceae bacterium]HRG32132.1 hypothetical protein [Saprospiraceae bacterium]
MNFEDQIEDYVFDRLLPDARTAFEIAMKENESLSNAVQDFKLAQSISKSLIEIEVRDQLNELKLKSSKVNRSYLFTLKRIAAIFIIVFGIVWLYKIYFPTYPTSDEIYSQLYEIPASSRTRSDKDTLSTLDSAQYYFEEYRWAEAKILFTRLLKADSMCLECTYYLGHLAMIEKDFKTARILFEEILSAETNSFREPSIYQLMLINLVEKNKKKAEPLYNDLQKKNAIANNKLKLIQKLLK